MSTRKSFDERLAAAKEEKALLARITKLDKWIAEEAANTKQPTLADIITSILDERGRYGLRGVLQDRYDPKKLPPITMWENQRAEKKAERDLFYREYEKLKTETQKVERIKRSVKKILHEDTPEAQSVERLHLSRR